MKPRNGCVQPPQSMGQLQALLDRMVAEGVLVTHVDADGTTRYLRAGEQP